MRLFLFIAAMVGLSACSQPSQIASAPSDQRMIGSDFSVAYEATDGGFKGMSLFVDPASGETWVAFRDDREAVSKEGFGDPLTPCDVGLIGCFRMHGQPLLSDLPPAGFLGGEFRFSSSPRSFWAMPCKEIRAMSDHGTTISIVCPVVGLVKFSFAMTGSDGPLERYRLKSMNGLFSQR